MIDRLNKILLVAGWAFINCAIMFILGVDLYHRFSERNYNAPDSDELQGLLDRAVELNDEAERLRREAADDIDKSRVKIDALRKFAKNYPDQIAEIDRRTTALQNELDAITKKQNDIDVLIVRVKILNTIVENALQSDR